VGGRRYEVDRYVESGPDTMCENCCGWGHLADKCTMPTRCKWCAGKHHTRNHECAFMGCKAGKGNNCPHTTDRCANCKGDHTASNSVCD
ncbi:hypothetical protein FN846DRAFT_767942, partial [Sphaerosporella brunnea]